MSLKFWSLAVLYHVCLGALCLFIVVRWQQRAASFTSAIIMDALRFVTTAILLACVAAAPLPDRRFAGIRFLSQALFAEAPALVFALAVLHWRDGRRMRSLVMGVILLGLLTVYVDAYQVEPYRLNIERHDLRLTSALEKPIDRTIRLLHVSDIQAWRVGDFEHHVVREMTRLDPDIVVMTGDYVQERLTPTGAQAARDLSDLLRRKGPRPPLGMYAVGGDTDDFGISGYFPDCGIHWLEDEIIEQKVAGERTIAIIGLTPPTSWGARPRTLNRLVSFVSSGSLRIVIGHSPDYVRQLDEHTRVDLALAGHTHGGQIALPFFGPPLTLSRLPRNIAAGGLHRHLGVPLHVSRGVGMERGSAPQIRFLCSPEICLLTLRY